MLAALIKDILLIPFKLIINGIRALIYNARGAIDTTGIYTDRWSKDDRVMLLDVQNGNQAEQVKLYADFDNNARQLSKLKVGDTVNIRWIPGAKWSMGRKQS